MHQKLFVLIRKDLPAAVQAVQAGHAVAEFCKRWQFFGNTDWNNETLIYLSVQDEAHLELWKFKLDSRGREYAEFREPDLNDQVTAIACMSSRNIFSNLPLWDVN